MINCLDSIEDVIRDRDMLKKPIALCCGCFDLLHVGHIHLLSSAYLEKKNLEYKTRKENGLYYSALLVVALNDDASVSFLKGPGRPIYTLEQRAALIAALRVVDYVISFNGNTIDLINKLKPAVYVKGDDRSIETMPERAALEACGTKIVTIERLPGISTTKTILRARKL